MELVFAASIPEVGGVIPPSEKLRVQTSERGHAVSGLHTPLLRRPYARLFQSLMESQSTVILSSAAKESAVSEGECQQACLNVCCADTNLSKQVLTRLSASKNSCGCSGRCCLAAVTKATIFAFFAELRSLLSICILACGTI